MSDIANRISNKECEEVCLGKYWNIRRSWAGGRGDGTLEAELRLRLCYLEIVGRMVGEGGFLPI